MDEYISREEVINITAETGAWETQNRVRELPAADVQPVKHGRWETWGYIFHGIAWKRCSVCGKTADLSYQALLDGEIEMATTSICGCCGARLESDNE